MRTNISALLASAAITAAITAAMTVAAPAAAQGYPAYGGGYGQGDYQQQYQGQYQGRYQDQYQGQYQRGYDDQQDGRSGGSGDVERQYRQIAYGIRHGLEDGSLDRRQAATFYRDLQTIHYRDDVQRQRGYFSPGQTRYSLLRLQQRIGEAHGRGHEWQDRHDGDWNDNDGYRR